MSLSENEVSPWFKKSQEDLSFAELGMQHKYFTHICFLCQQAAEKSFKAFLIAKVSHYPRTHRLPDLLKLCQEVDPEFARFKQAAIFLDDFYTPARYPDTIPLSRRTLCPIRTRLKGL